MSYSQRSTPVLAQLCSLLVGDMYGDLPARVLDVLHRRGRQRLVELTQASYLSKTQVGHGLVILTQQHLIFHSPNTEPITYYEPDWGQCYALVRLGKIIAFVEKRFGKKPANVISNLLTLGHTSLADLREAYFPPSQQEEGAGNAASAIASTEDDDTLTSPEELHDIVRTLMEHGWVIQVSEAQYLSPEDMYNLARQQALNDQWGGSIPTGTKDKDRLAQFIMANKRRTRDAWLEMPNFSSRKRKTNDSNGDSSGRQRLTEDGQYASVKNCSHSPEDDLIIRVNPEKAAVAMRNQHLVSLVEQLIGYTTARLYEIMLQSLEKNIPRCFEEYPDPPPANIEDQPQWEPNSSHVVNTRDIAQRAKMLRLDICNGLDPHAVARITKTTANNEGVLAQPVDHLSLGFHEREELVEAHFRLLVDHPLHFATWHARGQYRIDFDLMAKQLIQHEIEETLLAKHGTIGRKLVRALLKKGKLEERSICNVMMASAATVRKIVSDLALQGFVETQEVPKVDRREAKLSTHLVWYDTQRARERLLHDTYKGQLRLLQRINFEQEKAQELLTKANRTDVAGNETKYLKQSELDDLKKCKEVQEKLYLQLARQDDLVAVLRDYCGPLLTA